MRAFRRSAFALPVLACAIATAAGQAAAKTLVVKPHHSIQAAINAAKPGDTVSVDKGTYREALVIKTSRVTLKGPKATLMPPKNARRSPCDKLEPGIGICVVGSAKRNVSGVTISGITVQGFKGSGILGFQTKNLTVTHTHLLKNGGYGVFSNTSTGTRFLKNVASGNHAPGLYVGDSPKAHAVVTGNRVTGNVGEGILARSASFGTIKNNTFIGNCVGILVLADNPGPATNWNIDTNTVRNNNTGCAGDPKEGEPPLSGLGIVLSGAGSTTVNNNIVTGHKPLHNSIGHGGIVVLKGTGGTAPAGDAVTTNTAGGNLPADIVWDGSGTVTFTGNVCGASQPPGLC